MPGTLTFFPNEKNLQDDKYFSHVHSIRWRSSVPGDILDCKLKEAAEQSWTTASIFNDLNVQTFAHLISSSYWQTLFLFLGAFHFYLFYKSASKMDNNAWHISSVELQVIQMLNGDRKHHLQSNTIRLFYAEQEILGGSCRAPSNRSESMDAIDFPSSVCINNCILSLDGGLNRSGRMAYILWGSEDRWKRRTILGSSGARWTQDAARHALRAIQAESPVRLDLYPPWPWFLDTASADFILGSAFLLLAGCGRLNRAIHAKRLLHAHALLLAAAKVVAAAGYAACGRWREAASPAASCVLAVAVSAALARAKQFLFLCTVLALAALLGRTVDDCALFDDCPRLIDEPPLAAASIAALGAACALCCRRNRLRAFRGVAADQARYDAEWRRLQLREADDLARLEAAAAEAAAACPGGRARQLVRRQKFGPPQRWFSGMFDAEFLEPAPELAPVVSLDQLFAQAAGAAHFLRCACAEWAAATGGSSEAAEEAAADADAGGADGGCAWARLVPGLKSVRRAVAKAARCYRGDASRLLDICRARIVYGGAAGLLRGLEAIRAAGGGSGADGVRVVRVRNGLRGGTDGGRTAGFRVSACPLSARLGTAHGGFMTTSYRVN
jgi:hypothetical protein